MGFTDQQTKLLSDKLDKSVVKKRQGFDYIEGWYAISEANRIFGFDAWDRETQLSKLGEPELVGSNYRAHFMAVVTIRVRAGDKEIIRQGTGYGSGIKKDIGDAYEGAIKEAETDAMKRALMTFGNPFGLALYDKEKTNVGNPEVSDITHDGESFAQKWGENRANDILNAMRFPEAQLNLVRELTEEIAAADSRDALLIWSEENKRDIEELPDKLASVLREIWTDKRDSLPKGEKAHV